MDMRLNSYQESAPSDSDQAKIISDGTVDTPATEAIKRQIVETPTAKYLNREPVVKIHVRNVNFYYGAKQALYDVTLPIAELQETVERSLREAALWDEVKDRLKAPAFGLSGGQQQRLCIARAIAIRPEVILMDEPCSALDPIATQKIEELITELSKEYTIVIVTHNMQQAARVSHYTGFFLNGRLIEYAPTTQLFEHPTKRETEDYISGRFG